MPDFPPPKYVDDVTCREIYPELVQVFFDTNGLVRIELCVHRYSTQVPIHIDRIAPVGRIALHLGMAIALRNSLTQAIEAASRPAPAHADSPAGPTKN